MNKKLIVVLALAFVVGIAFAAYAEVQNVKVGGDFTAMAFSRNGFSLAKQTDPGKGKVDVQGLAQIANIKINADLTDAVSATMTLRNERIWGGSTGSSNTSQSSTTVYLAVGYVTLKDLIQEGWTFKVGQQVVKYGSGLIWGDPSTNQSASGTSNPFYPELSDFDPRIASTGIVATMDYSPMMLTAASVKINEGSLGSNDDTNGYLFGIGYNLEDVLNFKSVGELSFTAEDGKKTDIYIVDVRTAMTPAENVDVNAEYAYQAQKNATERADRKHMSDGAGMVGVTFGLPDVEMSPTIGLDYARISENWDPMYETLTPADIANALFPNANVSCFGVNIGAKPMDDLKLKLRYANLRLVKAINDTVVLNTFAPAGYVMTTKKNLGDEVDVHLTYDYTADVQFKLMGGYFVPGNAFDKDSNRKSASQVIGSMKVSF